MATKIILTVLYAAVATVLVIYTINPTVIAGQYSLTNDFTIAQTSTGKMMLARWTVHLLCILLVGLTLLEKDFITQLLNNKYTAKVLGYLGGSALYIYMLHMPFIYFYVQIRGQHPATPYSWAEIFWVVTLVSVVLGCVVKFLMDRFVLRKKPVKVENVGTMEVPDTAMQTVEVENTPKATTRAPRATKATAAKASTGAKAEPKKAEKTATKTQKTTTKKTK